MMFLATARNILMVIDFRGPLTEEHCCESYFGNLNSFHVLRVLGEERSTNELEFKRPPLIHGQRESSVPRHHGPTVPWWQEPKHLYTLGGGEWATTIHCG